MCGRVLAQMLAGTDALLAPDAVFRPWDDSKAFGRNGLLAAHANAELAGLQTVKRFVQQPELIPADGVEAKIDELVMRYLHGVVFGDPAHFRGGVELHAHARHDFIFLREQDGAEVAVGGRRRHGLRSRGLWCKL